MFAHSSAIVRLTYMLIVGVAVLLCAHRVADLIPLSSAWETATAAAPDCSVFRVEIIKDTYVIDCATQPKRTPLFSEPIPEDFYAPIDAGRK